MTWPAGAPLTAPATPRHNCSNFSRSRSISASADTCAWLASAESCGWLPTASPSGLRLLAAMAYPRAEAAAGGGGVDRLRDRPPRDDQVPAVPGAGTADRQRPDGVDVQGH